jgi:hypothetical protein
MANHAHERLFNVSAGQSLVWLVNMIEAVFLPNVPRCQQLDQLVLIVRSVGEWRG